MYKINLLPLELRGHFNVRQNKRFYITILVIASILFLVLSFSFSYRFILMQNELSRLNKQLIKLEPQVKEINLLQQEQKEVEKSNTVLENLIYEQRTWSYMLKDVKNILPVDTWLTSINIHHDARTLNPQPMTENELVDPNALTIEGKAFNVSSVGIFANSLNQLVYVEKAFINNINENPSEKVMDFSITVYTEESDSNV
ncbi:MAG: hypothetical protein FH756_09755 [Firmicutes bacterium]|nr:hypothetical protein [Bacillota bacterium]